MKKLTFVLLCLVLGISLATAQTSQVTGSVISAEDGEPIIGASIVVKGTTTGTVTDFDGKFNLAVPSSAKTLVFSYVGMASKEEAIKSHMKIVLNSNFQNLDEVVVVAYGTAKKSSFTGSAKAVTAEQLMAGSRESIDKALAGKVSGVRVSSSTGDPGAAGEINIRGVGSISASTSPLYVIDGVPIQVNKDMAFGEKSSSVLSTLNPEDIESMTILKDAAAASLYGSRAANGVVIITTKKGKSGKTKVSYSGEVGLTNMAVKQYEMISGKGWVDYLDNAMTNHYSILRNKYMEEYPNMAGATDQEWMTFAKNELIPKDMSDLLTDPTGNTSTDWRKEIFRNAVSQDHQVTMSGGSEKTRFYAGVGYNNSEGIVIGSSFDRLTGRLNLDHKVNNYVDVSIKQMIAVTNQNGFRDQGDQKQGLGTMSPLGILFSMDPTATVKNPDGTYNANAAYGQVSNPHIVLAGESAAREFVKSKTTRSLTNGDLSVKILPELVFKTVFGYDYTNINHQEYWSPTSVNGTSLTGLGQRVNYENKVITSSSTLRYNKTFNEVHNFDALVAFELESSNLLYVTASAKGYATDKLPELSVGQPYNTGSTIDEASMLSYLGNINYNYDNRYYASGSFRRDGSSRLGINNRWGNFWSASAAWRISEEGFLKDNDLFTDLKLRVSYGTNGTLPNEYYASQRNYSFNGGYGSSGIIKWGQPGNPDLSWEKSKNFNIGIDWNLFNRISLSMEYYDKTTTDLLFEVPSSIVTGFDKNWQNLGTLKNSGFEVEISSTNIKNKNFSWNTNFNFTYQHTNVKELPGGKDVSFGDGGMYIIKEGESLHSFYLPTWMGVNSETGLGEFLIDPSGDQNDSANRTNYYDKAGKSVAKKALPDVIGGLTNTFYYKDFDFSFLITYQFGGNLFDYPGYFSQGDGVRIGNYTTTKEVEDNYWKQPGDQAKHPKPIYGNPYRSDRWSTRHILSTDHIRLKDITLGYSVPEFTKYISKLRFYFRANNLAMIWSKTKGIDPEVPLNGYRQVDTPPTRNCALGVNIEF